MISEVKKILDEFEDLKNRYNEIKLAFNHDMLRTDLDGLQSDTLVEDFWKDKNNAQVILKKISVIERQIDDWSRLDDSFDEISLFLSMADDLSSLDRDLEESFNRFKQYLNKGGGGAKSETFSQRRNQL